MLAIPAGNHALHRRVNVLGRRYFTGRFSGVHDWPVLGVHRGIDRPSIGLYKPVVPPCPFLPSGVAVAVMARPVSILRLIALNLVAAIPTLAPAAHATPSDQSWVGGLYDNADFDDVILLIVSGFGAVQPSPLWSPRMVALGDHVSRTDPFVLALSPGRFRAQSRSTARLTSPVSRVFGAASSRDAHER